MPKRRFKASRYKFTPARSAQLARARRQRRGRRSQPRGKSVIAYQHKKTSLGIFNATKALHWRNQQDFQKTTVLHSAIVKKTKWQRTKSGAIHGNSPTPRYLMHHKYVHGQKTFSL